MKFNIKRIFIGILSVAVGILLLEGIGYAGIIYLSKSYQYSPVVEMSTDYVSKENPYLRLRKILMGAPGYIPRYYNSYNYNFGLSPNYSVDGITIHNEDGYKGPKINCLKGNKYRILFVGGYPTYGMLKDPDLSFPAQTGKVLNEYFKKDSVEIINGGIAEGTSAEDLNAYLHKFRYYKPDLVVIQSGATDAHEDLTGDDFTPDYANSRNYEMIEVERIVPKVLYHSYFITFLTIAAYYHPRNVDIERASTILHPALRPRWFPDELKKKIKQGDLSLHPYYNNLNTLVSEIISDSVGVMLMHVAINPHWKYYHPDFKDNVITVNKIIGLVASKYKVPLVPITYESISPEYWHDYSNLYPQGEKQKAKLIADRIIAIMSVKK